MNSSVGYTSAMAPEYETVKLTACDIERAQNFTNLLTMQSFRYDGGCCVVELKRLLGGKVNSLHGELPWF